MGGRLAERGQGIDNRDAGLRVLLVSDVRLHREGLASVLAGDGRLTVAGVAQDHGETLEKVVRLRPDAVLLDLGIREPHEAIRAIAAVSPKTHIVALGLTESTGDILACAEAGISGYVYREGSVDDLVRAVQDAAREEFSCSRQVAAALLRRVGSLAARIPAEPPRVPLTPREHQVVQLLDRGLTNKQISRRLFIEVTTVKNHVHNILEKLDVKTRGEAAAKVRRLLVAADRPGSGSPALG